VLELEVMPNDCPELFSVQATTRPPQIRFWPRATATTFCRRLQSRAWGHRINRVRRRLGSKSKIQAHRPLHAQSTGRS